VLPEPNPNVVDVEVGEGGFVEAAHPSVVEVINPLTADELLLEYLDENRI
jgi:hypothetical protein